MTLPPDSTWGFDFAAGLDLGSSIFAVRRAAHPAMLAQDEERAESLRGVEECDPGLDGVQQAYCEVVDGHSVIAVSFFKGCYDSTRTIKYRLDLDTLVWTLLAGQAAQNDDY